MPPVAQAVQLETAAKQADEETQAKKSGKAQLRAIRLRRSPYLLNAGFRVVLNRGGQVNKGNYVAQNILSAELGAEYKTASNKPVNMLLSYGRSSL